MVGQGPTSVQPPSNPKHNNASTASLRGLRREAKGGDTGPDGRVSSSSFSAASVLNTAEKSAFFSLRSADKFYTQCDPNRENLTLFAFPGKSILEQQALMTGADVSIRGWGRAPKLSSVCAHRFNRVLTRAQMGRGTARCQRQKCPQRCQSQRLASTLHVGGAVAMRTCKHDRPWPWIAPRM